MISILQLATLVAVLYVSAINEGECFLWPVPVECGKNEVSTTYQCPFNKCCIQKEYRLMYCYSSHTTSCECKNGYSRSIEGECIETKECEKDNDNVKECIKRCKGKPEKDVCKRTTSNSGCSDGWKYLYYYDRILRSCRISLYGCCGENRFKTLKECQNTCTETQEDCGPNEIYVPSMSPCNNCEKKGNCSGYFVQQAGCDCKKGFYRESDNKSPCIPERKCPKTSCKKDDEQYYESVPSCKNNCDAYFNDGIRCAGGPPGCFCREGLILNKDTDKCIEPKKCPNQKKPDVCKVEHKECSCDSIYTNKYYYDDDSKRCKKFNNNKCGENDNSFGSMDECEKTCKSEKVCKKCEPLCKMKDSKSCHECKCENDGDENDDDDQYDHMDDMEGDNYAKPFDN